MGSPRENVGWWWVLKFLTLSRSRSKVAGLVLKWKRVDRGEKGSALPRAMAESEDHRPPPASDSLDLHRI